MAFAKKKVDNNQKIGVKAIGSVHKQNKVSGRKAVEKKIATGTVNLIAAALAQEYIL